MLNAQLIVQNAQFSYPVFIGDKLISSTTLWQELVLPNQIFIISDEHVAPHYLEPLMTSLGNRQLNYFILKAGEASKNLIQFEAITDALVNQNYGRDSLIIGLGGGMVTDIAGFTAACYMRGIAFITIPTTLLAQVDAAIGGKTALNHAKAKNLIGFFHQPTAVIIDIDSLNTLPDREFRAGLAEVIKMAVTLDADFFSYLESHITQILARDKTILSYLIQRCCELKASIVQADEKEQGIRSILNFGHTYGHALESFNHYATYLHGEAVAIGMVIAAEISVNTLNLNPNDKDRLINLIASVGLPTSIPSTIDQAELNQTLALDKKVRDGKLRMVLLEKIGCAKICSDWM